jgi:hypothetical protein
VRANVLRKSGIRLVFIITPIPISEKFCRYGRCDILSRLARTSE